MVYYASSGRAPAQVACGPVTYRNPYYKTTCGCGTANSAVEVTATGAREGFNPNGNGKNYGPAPADMQQAPLAAGPVQPPMCTLTATAPPAGCCHPAPLHLII